MYFEVKCVIFFRRWLGINSIQCLHLVILTYNLYRYFLILEFELLENLKFLSMILRLLPLYSLCNLWLCAIRLRHNSHLYLHPYQISL